MREQVLRIPLIGPSLNEYDRANWRKRRAWVSQWALLVKAAAKSQGLTLPESYPVRVEMECHFGPGATRYDWDNLSPTAKLIQDGLVHAGVLHNDSSPYVRGGYMEAFRTKEESYTLFKIIESEKP